MSMSHSLAQANNSFASTKRERKLKCGEFAN